MYRLSLALKHDKWEISRTSNQPSNKCFVLSRETRLTTLMSSEWSSQVERRYKNQRMILKHKNSLASRLCTLQQSTISTKHSRVTTSQPAVHYNSSARIIHSSICCVCLKSYALLHLTLSCTTRTTVGSS
ncbi:hypothetical protein Tcan_01154, partial [Toxocara canis]